MANQLAPNALETWTAARIQTALQLHHHQDARVWRHTLSRGFSHKRLRFLHEHICASGGLMRDTEFEFDTYRSWIYQSMGTSATEPQAPVQAEDDHTFADMMRSFRMLTAYEDAGMPPRIHEQSRSGFFRLPPEVRNQIYGYALTEPAGIPVKMKALSDATGLMRACKETRAEASSIFYSDNIFLAWVANEDCHAVSNWVKAIGRHAAHIQTLVVQYEVSASEWDPVELWSSQLFIHTPKTSEALPTIFFNMDKTLGQLFTDLREETVLPLFSIGCLMLPAGPTLFASPAYLMQLLSVF